MHREASVSDPGARRHDLGRFSIGRLSLVLAAFLVAFGVGDHLGAQDAAEAGTADLTRIKEEFLADAEINKRLTWVLGFKPLKVRMVTPRRGPKKGRTFWYVVYQIENKAREDHQFYLALNATSDRKRVYTDLFLPSVERAAEEQEKTPLWGKTDKFLKVLKDRAPGDRKYSYEMIKAGEKRLCVAVFNAFDPTSKNLTIRVKGLTNDVGVVESEGETFLRQRVRVIHVRRPGDEYEFGNDMFKKMRTEWVTEVVKLEIPEKDAGDDGA